MKVQRFLFFVLILLSFALVGCGGDEPSPTPGDDKPSNEKPNTPGGDTSGKYTTKAAAIAGKGRQMHVYAHYMPWFVSPSSQGVWNHWTMSTQALRNDLSNLASNFNPLYGAYSSTDEAVLDYQCLLMKCAGIEGIMIDWYGTQNKNDYPQNERGTQAIVRAATKAGLRFAIVYEDATLNETSSKLSQAKADIAYLSSHYFNNEYYTTVGERPLLLVFGPQALTEPDQWTQALAGTTVTPLLVALNGHGERAGTTCAGEYLWVNPSPAQWYSSARSKWSMVIGGAMPGFYDVYKRFGQGAGYTTYDRLNGQRFINQLGDAASAGLQWVQISTWNDYGEGTIIEPTREFGLQYLGIVQQFVGSGYDEDDLQVVCKWYEAKIARPGDAKVEQAYSLLREGKHDQAATLLNTQ